MILFEKKIVSFIINELEEIPVSAESRKRIKQVIEVLKTLISQDGMSNHAFYRNFTDCLLTARTYHKRVKAKYRDRSKK